MARLTWAWTTAFVLGVGGVVLAGCGGDSSPSASGPIAPETVNLSVSVQFPNGANAATVGNATQLVIPAETTRIVVNAFSVSELFPYVLEPPLELTPSSPSGVLPSVPVGAQLEIIATAFDDSGQAIASGFEQVEIGPSSPTSIELDLEEIFITFDDSGLEAIVRSALELSASEPITVSAALELTTLNAANSSITDLGGLEFFTNLTDIDLSGNAIADIQPLVSNVGLGSGATVDLTENPLSSTARQAQIPALESRGVLVEFTQVIEFVDSALEAVVRSALGLSSDEPITESSALELTTLDAPDSSISNLSGLEFFTNLTDINLSGNAIADIQPLLNNTGLDSDAAIDLTNNPLSATARQVQVPALESRGVQVLITLLVEIDDPNLESAVRASLGLGGSAPITADDAATLTFFSARNQSIEDLSGLDSFANLETLDLAENAIADLTPLSALTNLTFLDLSNNDVVTIQPLVDNAGIGSQDFLSLQGNPLSADSLSVLVPELQSRGAIVTTTVQPNVTVVPYLSFEDSPFRSFSGSNPNVAYFELETFEDGSFDVPGVTASAGRVSSPENVESVDSVDGDDGAIDGSGLQGRSFTALDGTTGIEFSFDAGTLGQLPDFVGIVWTDGEGMVTLDAFDAAGMLMGTSGPLDIADGFDNGTTAEDRFIGLTSTNGGIASIRIRNTAGGIEVDHLQYGAFVD